MEQFYSVGIDVGTATTQVIFSKITVANVANVFSVPRVEIVDKEIVYRGKIYFTPIIAGNEINLAELESIIEKEYFSAGIKKEEVATGAVIITGETARKENAEAVLHALSSFAGDFVVATAGPELEAIVAGKGAGTDKISKETGETVINFDIGGGTTNMAVFRYGRLLEAGCLDIGGRLLRIDDRGKVLYIAEKLQELLRVRNVLLEKEQRIEDNTARKIAQEMARILEMAVSAATRDESYKNLICVKGISEDIKVDGVSFSGGVADFIYNELPGDKWLYNDIGVWLGEAIKKSEMIKKYKLYQPQETIRATVVGAGTHSVSISGSTIMYTNDIFPLKNIPVVEILHEENFASEVREKLLWFKQDGIYQQVAIAFKGKQGVRFVEVQELAQEIYTALNDVLSLQEDYLIFLIVSEDMAKVLGQSLYALLREKKMDKCNVLSLDKLEVHMGDYIDVGRPIARGAAVPVVIKTLVFK